MAIYTIDQQGEGIITGVTASKVIRFGAGLLEATPATQAEVESLTPTSSENKKYMTLYNIAKYLQARKIAVDLNGVNVPQIEISSVSLSTTTKDINNLSQNGKSVLVENVGDSVISVVTTSEPNFVAVYTKIGTGTLTFNAGTGVTLTQVNGTNIVNENKRASLTRLGTTNTFLLDA